MITKFRDLSIKARVFAGFGLTLVLVMIEGGFSVLETRSIISDVSDADRATVLISDLQTLSVSTSQFLEDGSQGRLSATLEKLGEVESKTLDLVGKESTGGAGATAMAATFRDAASAYAGATEARNSRMQNVQGEIAGLISATVQTADQSKKKLAGADNAVLEARAQLDAAQEIINEANQLIIAMNNVELAMVLFDTRQSKANQKKLTKSIAAARPIVDKVLAMELDENTRSVVNSFIPFIDQIQAAIDKVTAVLAEKGEITKKDRLGLIKSKITARKAVKIAVNVMKIQREKMSLAQQVVSDNLATKGKVQDLFDAALALETGAFSLLNGFALYLNEPSAENSASITAQLGSLQTAAKNYADQVSKEEAARSLAIVDGFGASQQAFLETEQQAAAARSAMSDAAGGLTDMVRTISRDQVDAVISSGTTASNIILIVTIAVTAFSILLFLYAGRLLQALTEGIRKLASGRARDVNDSPALERKDEIGEMARAIKVFSDKEKERQEAAARSAEEQKERTERARRIERLVNDFRETVTQILGTVSNDMGQMQQTASRLSDMAADTSSQAGSAVQATDNASASVQTVAAAAEQLSASITEISRQVAKTSEVVGEATDTTRNTNDKISGLAEGARRIGDVVTLIQDIAEQTNLLALNATIEAARAGDMGKGFAVVANEVKSLANQTAQATDEIGKQVGDIQGSTNDAVAAIKDIAERMEGVNSYTGAIAAAVEQQGAATAEISENVGLAAKATRDAASNMQTVSQSVEETSHSATEVQETSSATSEQTDKLRQTVDAFLREVAEA